MSAFQYSRLPTIDPIDKQTNKKYIKNGNYGMEKKL